METPCPNCVQGLVRPSMEFCTTCGGTGVLTDNVITMADENEVTPEVSPVEEVAPIEEVVEEAPADEEAE